jgi:hypothetical protein
MRPKVIYVASLNLKQLFLLTPLYHLTSVQAVVLHKNDGRDCTAIGAARQFDSIAKLSGVKQELGILFAGNY